MEEKKIKILQRSRKVRYWRQDKVKRAGRGMAPTRRTPTQRGGVTTARRKLTLFELIYANVITQGIDEMN